MAFGLSVYIWAVGVTLGVTLGGVSASSATIGTALYECAACTAVSQQAWGCEVRCNPQGGEAVTLGEIMNQISQLETTVTAQASTIQAQQAIIVTLQADVAALQANGSTRQTSIDNMQVSLTNVQTTVSAHAGSITAVETVNTNQQQQIDAVDTTVAGHTTTINGHTTTLTTHGSSITALQTTTSGHTTDLSTHAQNIASIQTVNSGQASDIAALQTETSHSIGFYANSPPYSTHGPRIFVFANAIINNGGGYNAGNGRFTATVAGLYYFATGIAVDGSAVVYGRIKKNGNDISFSYSSADTVDATYIGCSTVAQLVPGDYVEVHMTNTLSVAPIDSWEYLTYFTGFRIGP